MFHIWERRRLHKSLGWGNKKEYAHLKKLVVDERILFKSIFKNKTSKCGLDSCLSG
jgi:hypothetical protein